MFSLFQDSDDLRILKTDEEETKTVIFFTSNETREYALECVRALNAHFNPDNVTRHNNRSTIRAYPRRGNSEPFFRRHFDNNRDTELPVAAIIQYLPEEADLENVIISIRPEQAGN